MSKTLTDDEAKVVAELLRLASNTFSNHGCNDFDLRQYKLAHMARELNELEHPDEEDRPPDMNNPVMMDWLLMDRFADKLDPKGGT